jgi:hypothetical protein
MSTFEFVSVLLSIVVTLAFTHLLTGIARLINAKDVKFSLVWAGWIGALLFGCVDYWFSLWQARATAVWSLAYVVFWLLLATALYLTAWLAVPEFDRHERVDLVAFHEGSRRKYLGALIIVSLLGSGMNLTVETFRSVVPTTAAWLAVIAAAWLWRGRWVQLAALAAYYAMLVWYALNYIPAL